MDAHDFLDIVIEEFEDILHEYREEILRNAVDDSGGFRITRGPGAAQLAEVSSVERVVSDRFRERLELLWEEWEEESNGD